MMVTLQTVVKLLRFSPGGVINIAWPLEPGEVRL